MKIKQYNFANDCPEKVYIADDGRITETLPNCLHWESFTRQRMMVIVRCRVDSWPLEQGYIELAED